MVDEQDFIEKEIIDVDKSSIVDETNNVDKMKTKIWIFHEKLNLNYKEIGDIDDENKSNIIDKNYNVYESDQNENEI